MSGWVLVTGGTGFVGGLVVTRLLADGHQVRALVRRPADVSRLPERAERAGIGARLETVLGDLDDEESLTRAADGCELVYHVAGLNTMCASDPSRLYRVNVDGAERMLRAARRAGVRRVVVTSSAGTLGGDGSHPVNEHSPAPAHFTSHYTRSKHQGEVLALAFDGVEVVAVNPSSVQGPGRRGGTARLLISHLNGRLRVAAQTRFGLCYTDDCAAGHVLAAAKGRPGQRYALNTATLSTLEALDLVGSIAGIEGRPRLLPGPVAMTVAAAAEFAARLRGRKPRICRESVRTMLHPHVYDGSRAERELGLTYTPVRTALERAVRWYADEGLVDRPLPGLQDRPDGPGAS